MPADAEGVRRGAPSMQQSLWLTTDLYALAHYGLGLVVDPYSDVWWKRFLSVTAIGAFDALTIELPGLAAWQHEEWHRAVMAYRHIDSYDDIYDFRIFSSLVNVSHVSDADLVRLKAEHPADHVRLSAAGIEGNYELARNIEKARFFGRTNTYDGVLVTILHAENFFYWNTCATSGDQYRAQEADVSKRDFTGLDCTAWTYDLFRPDEAFAARGLDPSGVGIQRYRGRSDLTDAEQSYLSTQRWLSLLNFLDPNVVGINAFESGETRWNAAARHVPTSFGSDSGVDVFFQRRPIEAFARLHLYANRTHVFPGAEAELWRVRAVPSLPIDLSFTAAAWLQPAEQRFETSHPAPGGLLRARIRFPFDERLAPYSEIEVKTAGWVAGNVALGPSGAIRMGVTASLF
jgi:hypothetical protein